MLGLLAWYTHLKVDDVRIQSSALASNIEAASDMEAEQALLAGRIRDLEAWQAQIEHLRKRRVDLVAIWSELAVNLPDSMHFSGLTLAGPNFGMQGTTTSSPDLATYLRRLENSAVLDSPRLIDLQDTPLGKQFAVAAVLRNPASEL